MPVSVAVADTPAVSVAAAPPVVTSASILIPGAPGPNEVWIGPTEPTDPEVEIWYKP